MLLIIFSLLIFTPGYSQAQKKNESSAKIEELRPVISQVLLCDSIMFLQAMFSLELEFEFDRKYYSKTDQDNRHRATSKALYKLESYFISLHENPREGEYIFWETVESITDSRTRYEEILDLLQKANKGNFRSLDLAIRTCEAIIIRQPFHETLTK
jgi:hypothetical protein